ncbi:uncharacterized protein LOC143563753 [Bidens hawaiensis]|uniref:uncharacterized protein LOC143563753 n=1 Tax=Bidens hawaiensis TaxID=980011 RepID=UPI00404B19DA
MEKQSKLKLEERKSIRLPATSKPISGFRRGAEQWREEAHLRGYDVIANADAAGTLPRNTEQNPKGFAEAVITRSGARARDEPVIQEVTTEGVVDQPAVDGEEQVDEEILMESLPAKVHQRRSPASTAQAEKQAKPPLRVYKPKFPYPGRLQMDRDKEQNAKFLELLKQLHLNVPFLEVLTQMPKYAKFLKDILTNKQKLAEVSYVPLSAGFSAILQSKLPEKMADPGSFMILCILVDDTVSHALADLRASINLMSYSVFSRLGLGEPRPTRMMSIQLADQSVKYPCGIVENMLVRIGKFFFLVDFVILDMNKDDSVLLILGRPFLATTQALIDVRDGKLVLRVGDENVTFDVRQSLKHPKSADDSLYFIDMIMTHLREFFNDICGGSTLDTQILDREIPEVEMVAITEQPSYADAESSSLDSDISTEIVRVDPKDRPSVKSPPSSLELKDLPTHLECAFLDEERKLPVIIASALTEGEMMKLLKVLRAHKEAIAWKIIDIKSVNPSFCTHKIIMEDDFITVVQLQRRLNPKMQEVVKKEIFKLLDAGIIFPISDSPWMLECLAGQQFYYFLDGFSGYFQIPITPDDQEKTIFTCPYGTFAYKRMPFGLCNAPATFQRYMVAIFHYMIEDSMEGADNVAAEHLSRLERAEVKDEVVELDDRFPTECLMFVKVQDAGYPWFADIANFLVHGSIPKKMSHQQKKKFFADVKFYIWDDPYLFRIGADQLRTKELHDRKLQGNKQFKCGDTVLLFNSRLKLISGKLKSRWYGPYTVKEVFPYGAVEIEDKNGSFKVNGQRLKHYISEKVEEREGVVLRLTAFDA